MTRLPAPTSPIHGALTLPAPYAAVIGINERLGQWAMSASVSSHSFLHPSGVEFLPATSVFAQLL